MSQINIGIAEADRIKVAESLGTLLADSYTLYLQTHNFHWNVTGKRFHDLHLLFEEHYIELATAVDEIAERIRALGEPAPATYAAFSKMSAVKEVDGVPSAEEMVKILTQGHEQVVRTARSSLAIAQQAADESSASLVGDRMRLHEKVAWMLRSMQ
jgi:starvation-inducible DNA-binding protein